MADNLTYSGSGSTVPANTVQRTDDLGAAGHVPYVKLLDGTDGGTGAIPGDATNGLDVDVTRVPAPLSTTGGGTEATALRVTLATDSTGVVSVDDNGAALSVDDGGGSLTIDGTVSVSGTVTVDSELTTADLDTGAGTDTRAVVGLVLAASGGGALVGTANPMPVSDNGGSLTVDGTVAATQSGTWTEANSAAIKTAVETLDNAIAGTEMQVDVVAALPAGNNNIGDVDIATLPSGSVAAATAKTSDFDTGAGTDTVAMFGLALPASGGAVPGGTSTNPVRTDPTGTTTQPVSDAGGSLTVDGSVSIGAALPAGDNNIGNVDVVTLPALPAGTNNIGDVDVASLPSGSVAAATAKTADFDSGAGTDTVPMFGVALPASGGAVAGGTSTNPLRTDPTGTTTQPVSGTVTANAGSGTFVVGDGGGSLTVDGTVAVSGTTTTSDTASQVDDAAFTPGTGRVLMIGAEADETTPDAVDEGDGGALRMTLQRGLHANLRNASGTEIGTAAAPVRVDPTGTTAQPVTDNGSTLSIDDGAGSITVDGSVSLAAAIPAGTNNIGDVDVLTLPALPAGTNNIGDVDVLTLPGSLQGYAEDAVHTTGDVGVQALAVRKDTGAAIAGTDGDYSPLQVDASGNLRVNVAAGGAGDGAILDGVSSAIKATVLDYTNSNPLAVRLTDTAGDYVSAGAGTQYTEDAVAAADPTGTMVIAVRADALAAVTTTDGDNIAARATNKGELYVKHADAIPVTDNGGNLSIDDGGNSITVDGTVAVSGTVTVDSELTTADLDTGAGTDTRAVVGLVLAASGGGVLVGSANPMPISDNAGSLTVDGSVSLAAAIPAGTNNIGDVDVLSIAAGDNNIGNVDIVTMPNVTLAAGTNTNEVVGDAAHDAVAAGNPVLLGGYASAAAPADVSADGDVARLWTTLKGAVHVADAGGALSVDDNGGSLTVDGTVALGAGAASIGTLGANSGIDIGDVTINNASGASAVNIQDGGNSITVDGTVTVTDGLNVEGDIAHDAADSGNPVKIGAKAVAHGANPTAVAAGDRTDLYANRHGIPFVIGGHPNAKSATYITTAAGTDDNVLAAIATGTKYGITRISIYLDAAATVSTAVRLGFGTASVPTLGASQADAVDDILCYHPGLIPGGGFQIGDGSGLIGVGGDGAELRITNSVPTGGTLVVSVTYFSIES